MDNYATAVNQVAFRDAGHSIVYRGRTVGIDDVGVGDPVGLLEVQPIALRVFIIDANKDNTLASCTLPRGLQKRSFMFTRIAPRRPEIEHDGLSPEACQV